MNTPATPAHAATHPRTVKNAGACPAWTQPGTASSFPAVAAVQRAAQAVIERADLPAIAVTATVRVQPARLLEFLTEQARTPAELDTVWEALIDRARRSEDWQLIALGMVAPRLAQVAACAARRTHAALRAEIASAVLAAFTEELLTASPDPACGLIVHQLLRPAQAAAQRVIDRHTSACRRAAASLDAGEDAGGQQTAVGYGPTPAPNHPDIALARLVAGGVISRDEAELIGRHRIERVMLRDLGAERGWYPMQATRALRRAEAKVARALGHQAR